MAGLYKRRTPEKTALYKIAYNYFNYYESIYPLRYEKEYGPFRKIIGKTVNKYLECGIMDKGFARIRCPQCGKDYFIAFSCKTRFFCPSCSQKRTLIWGDWVKSNVLENVAHRQWVFTIPKILRKLFYKDRKLLGQLAKCAKDTVAEIFSSIYPDYKPGIVLSIQTFGDLLLWHPHIHCLITDGVFDKENNFYPIPKVDTKKAVIVFREKVFDMLKRNARISTILINKMRGWQYTGFSVHNAVLISEDNPDALSRLAEYIVHASFSSEKITFSEKSHNIIYRSKMHPGKNRNFEILDAIEFLHRVCLHIPDHYECLIRYYGYYSNASRGKRKKRDIKIINDPPDIRSARRSWAMLIYKVYEIDPLKCPVCGSDMKIIAFIQERHEIIKILKHIGMYPTEIPVIESRASPHEYLRASATI